MLPTCSAGKTQVVTTVICEEGAELGDHLLVRYSLKSATDEAAAPLFSMGAWEQQHLLLGERSTPAAFNEGLLGMCAGERRRLIFSGEEFGLSDVEAAITPTVVSEVELITLTPQGDYHIFDLIDVGDVASILDMVDHHAGVNAVDRAGNSALMAAVQSGARMQMVVATLLNAWRPKVDVGFTKPSGHSVLFYAVTQDDSKGTAILKALLKRGADPNDHLRQPDMLGWTPLHFACKFMNTKHAALLLEYGADPLAETSAGLSVLDAAKDASFSVRKKLANLLNEALAAMEDDAAAIANSPNSEL